MDLSIARELDSPTVISDEVGDEVLAINIATGAYYVIAPSSLGVWQALSTGVPASQLLKGPTDPRTEALGEFLAALVDGGLLREATTVSNPTAEIPWSGSDLSVEEHTDLADLIWLDVIHDADQEVGWPVRRQFD